MTLQSKNSINIIHFVKGDGCHEVSCNYCNRNSIAIAIAIATAAMIPPLYDAITTPPNLIWISKSLVWTSNKACWRAL